MPGPPPKLDHLRRRRNKPGLKPLPAAGYSGEFPPLPNTYRHQVWDNKAQRYKTARVRFLAETRRWYKTWATSKLAHDFTDVHWLRLREIAQLKDRLERGDLRIVSEYRQAIAAFGGTPADLRRLGRRVERPARDAPPATVRRLRAIDPNDAT